MLANKQFDLMLEKVDIRNFESFSFSTQRFYCCEKKVIDKSLVTTSDKAGECSCNA